MQYYALTMIAGFNTQPPEGGCWVMLVVIFILKKFQHTAARRRLQRYKVKFRDIYVVSTHSRPKAAARINGELCIYNTIVSTHSRPKAAAPYIKK